MNHGFVAINHLFFEPIPLKIMPFIFSGKCAYYLSFKKFIFLDIIIFNYIVVNIQ